VPQALLPLIPDGATQINDRISVIQKDGRWTYFCGIHPIFDHAADDHTTFQWHMASLIDQGICRQAEILKTFGVSKNAVKRWGKKFREGGVKAFYQPRPKRGSTVMTLDVVRRAQELLFRRWSRSDIAAELGIKRDTLCKAIQHGRIQEPSRDTSGNSPASPTMNSAGHGNSPIASPAGQPVPAADSAAGKLTDSSACTAVPSDPAAVLPQGSDKSQRTRTDAAAGDEMGVACTRTLERVSAALGILPGGAPTQFEHCRGVSFGGTLCALPALIQNGLFNHLGEIFPTLGGYYTTLQVVTLLAMMALGRIKTVEQLQYVSPGELGKLLGLDRIPEVRCLRNKLAQLSLNNAPEQWAERLSRDWLQDSGELAGMLYVDGHVRLYHGSQTELPRRYVSRQRLCLRGTTGYWVNDAIGQPFFVVERPIDQGLIEALTFDIVPRLLKDVPNQPTAEDLAADPYRFRFAILFDREGYSPKFFKDMWQQHRIACITYHKHPKEAWPEELFQVTEVRLPNGECVSLKLAEMGSWVGGKDGLWMREIRKLAPSGHQTSLISTAYGHEGVRDAAQLFSRWSQENFFRYMMQHFAIDLLSEYQTDEIPGTNRPVVNPPWRELDKQVRSLKGRLTQRQAKFAALTLHPEDDAPKVAQWERRKAVYREEIEQFEHELAEVVAKLKQTPKHVEWKDLPAEDKFERLAPSRKRLLDTVKMIAYRAETAMANVLREPLSRDDDARSLLCDLFRSEADLHPDAEAGVLRVNVHSMANPRSNRAIGHLMRHLNEAELPYPGTNLKLVFSVLDTPET
jgi:hypothetical protein